MKLALKVLVGILVAIYPFAVFFGLEYFEPKYLALFLCAIILLRFVSFDTTQRVNGKKSALVLIVIGLAIALYTMISNTIDGLKFYPVIISFSFLFAFSYSLYYPPSAIERVARLTEPNLDKAGVTYTRLVTKIWCLFFIVNGLVALYTSLFTSVEVWTLYNGLISYFLMGSLFAGEFIYRYFFIKKSVK